MMVDLQVPASAADQHQVESAPMPRGPTPKDSVGRCRCLGISDNVGLGPGNKCSPTQGWCWVPKGACAKEGYFPGSKVQGNTGYWSATPCTTASKKTHVGRRLGTVSMDTGQRHDYKLVAVAKGDGGAYARDIHAQEHASSRMRRESDAGQLKELAVALGSKNMDDRAAPRARAAHDANARTSMHAQQQRRQILLVRVSIGKMHPDYCDEACCRALMWTGKLNVNALVRDASYGGVTFDEEDGEVVTVYLPELGPMYQQLCQHWLVSKKVDEVLETMGFANSDFLHRVYFLPQQWSDCSFSGLAWFECRETMACKTWMRVASVITLAHELGHNLGLLHSGTDFKDIGSTTTEYGDESCVMGHGTEFVSVNAPNRMRVGWIDQNHIIEIDEHAFKAGSMRQVKLMKLSAQPTEVHTQQNPVHTVLQLPRIGGGIYVVSFRFDEQIVEEGLCNPMPTLNTQPAVIVSNVTYSVVVVA